MAMCVACCWWLQGMGMVKEAEQAFLRGLEHEPDMYELVANMGVLLLDAYVHPPQTGPAPGGLDTHICMRLIGTT